MQLCLPWFLLQLSLVAASDDTVYYIVSPILLALFAYTFLVTLSYNYVLYGYAFPLLWLFCIFAFPPFLIMLLFYLLLIRFSIISGAYVSQMRRDQGLPS